MPESGSPARYWSALLLTLEDVRATEKDVAVHLIDTVIDSVDCVNQRHLRKSLLTSYLRRRV